MMSGDIVREVGEGPWVKMGQQSFGIVFSRGEKDCVVELGLELELEPVESAI